MTDPARSEVTVVNVDYWARRVPQLAQLLGGSTPGRVIADPEGGAPQPDRLLALTDPDYWAADPTGLGDALADLAEATSAGSAAADDRSSGAVAPGTDRLTLTVEEAAATLGISRAFAYEAVRRGEIPSIRIGRRVLVPRAALDRMLGTGTAPGDDE